MSKPKTPTQGDTTASTRRVVRCVFEPALNRTVRYVELDECLKLERENATLRERVAELEDIEEFYRQCDPLFDQLQGQDGLSKKIGLKVGQSITKDGIPLPLAYIAELERDRERLDAVIRNKWTVCERENGQFHVLDYMKYAINPNPEPTPRIAIDAAMREASPPAAG